MERRTARTGAAAAETPGNGHRRPCPIRRDSPAEDHPSFPEETGRREKEALLHWQVQQRLQKRLPRFKYRLGMRTPYLADLWRFCKRIAPGAEVRQCKFPRGSTLASPYAAHQKMVRKRFPEKMDESRLDAANVLYMRCTGYTPQDVANALYRHIPVRPKNKTMTKG